MPSPSMSDSATPAQRYKHVPYGGGVEELDRFAIRDRIRAGDITADTELALLHTDEWRAAASFPELSRYFEMAAAQSPRTHSGPEAGSVSMIRTSAPRTVSPMGERVLNGLLFPIAGGEAFLLIGLAVLNAIPFIGVLASIASTFIMVEIVRTSANGRTKMPLVDTSQVSSMLWTYLRVLFVTLVSLLPVFVFGGFAFTRVLTGTMSPAIALMGMALALAVAALYYPACLATVAVWDNVLDSLNPVYVMRVIRIIGADYFIVVGMWFVATLLTMLASSPFISPLAAIPFVGAILSGALSFWALFYVSHLLGYAVYRHARELGWE